MANIYDLENAPNGPNDPVSPTAPLQTPQAAPVQAPPAAPIQAPQASPVRVPQEAPVQATRVGTIEVEIAGMWLPDPSQVDYLIIISLAVLFLWITNDAYSLSSLYHKLTDSPFTPFCSGS